MLVNINTGTAIPSLSEVLYEVGIPSMMPSPIPPQPIPPYPVPPQPFPPKPYPPQPVPPVPIPIPGIQGTQGIQGYPGLHGHMGPQGTTGIQGYVGVQGIQGEQGIQGPEGPEGLEGIQGAQGSIGLNGHMGPQGAIGEQGIQGVQGPVGDITLDPTLFRKNASNVWTYPGVEVSLPDGECPEGGYVLNHNLDMYPVVTCFNSEGIILTPIDIEVQYPDKNNVILKWQEEISNTYCVLK